jgi:hypothetical protein
MKGIGGGLYQQLKYEVSIPCNGTATTHPMCLVAWDERACEIAGIKAQLSNLAGAFAEPTHR